MKTTVGLWIDHRKAVIAVISEDGEETLEIQSNVEKQPGRAAGVRSTYAADEVHMLRLVPERTDWTRMEMLRPPAIIACGWDRTRGAIDGRTVPSALDIGCSSF